MTGIELIAAERQRQIDEEGWTPSHDDEHTDGSLALAAVCYATPEKLYVMKHTDGYKFIDPWPDSWDYVWDKRYEYSTDPSEYTDKQRIDLLKKAGALIAAEIDRLQRI